MQQSVTGLYSSKHLLYILPVVLLLATCSDRVTSPPADESDTGDPAGGSGNREVVGYSAGDLLSDARYEKLIVQVQYMAGAEPTQAALEGLLEFLEQHVYKASIEIRKDQIEARGKETYSLAEIRALEDENRIEYNRHDTIAAYYLYLDGGYQGDDDNSFVLGIAFRNTSMALFQQNIESVSGGLGRPSQTTVETTVLNHEFGHILGLVGIGYETGHKDEEHGNHCDNEQCLLYYTATTDAIASLIGSSVPDLGENCLRDLRAKGGK
ncbi:MAG: hypothetical protein WD266_10890 [Balneolales bacterium]